MISTPTVNITRMRYRYKTWGKKSGKGYVWVQYEDCDDWEDIVRFGMKQGEQAVARLHGIPVESVSITMWNPKFDREGIIIQAGGGQ